MTDLVTMTDKEKYSLTGSWEDFQNGDGGIMSYIKFQQNPVIFLKLSSKAQASQLWEVIM